MRVPFLCIFLHLDALYVDIFTQIACETKLVKVDQEILFITFPPWHTVSMSTSLTNKRLGSIL